MNAGAERFESHRTQLLRHAYRMLGGHTEAEDVVQDAFVRWNAALTTAVVVDDRAFLRATVTRLCLDRLRSARARRELYIGQWLPEPLITPPSDDPQAIVTLADDVSFALMLALERLSALERAAFLLHDVMDVPFAEIAATLGRSEHAVRQLASRARAHIREPGRRSGANMAEALRLREQFIAAIRNDDLSALGHLLAGDVVCISDSGGKVPAALLPVKGANHVGRLLLGLARKARPETRLEPVFINGSPGFIIFEGDRVIQTLALDVADRCIVGIYMTRNPDKLRAFPTGTRLK